MPANSMPEQGRYFFMYRVKISNEGSKTVILKSRHWVITDGTGRVEEVR
jgi:ApaG protein